MAKRTQQYYDRVCQTRRNGIPRTLLSPEGERHTFFNLARWVRDNHHRFDPAEVQWQYGHCPAYDGLLRLFSSQRPLAQWRDWTNADAAPAPNASNDPPFRLIGPDGVLHTFNSVSRWVRQNPHLFDAGDLQWKRGTCRAAWHLHALLSKGHAPFSEWKGWVNPDAPADARKRDWQMRADAKNGAASKSGPARRKNLAQHLLNCPKGSEHAAYRNQPYRTPRTLGTFRAPKTSLAP
jgi:hypothetical protein